MNPVHRVTRVLPLLLSVLLVTSVASCSEGNPEGMLGPTGGTISFDDGRIEIEVPAEALTENVQLMATLVEAQASGGIGPAYELGPEGVEFAHPVTVRIKFSEAELAGVEEPDFINAGELVGSEWRAVGNASFDLETRTLSFVVSGFGAGIEESGSSSSALLTQVTACGDDFNLVAPASPHTVQGVPAVIVDSTIADDSRCAGQRQCKHISAALALQASGMLPAAAVVVVRPGIYSSESNPMTNQQGGETFPINTAVTANAGIQLVAPMGATLVSKGTPVFETTSFPTGVVEGFTLETQPLVDGDPRPRSIRIHGGSAVYQDIDEMEGGGVQIDGGYAFVRDSTLTAVDIDGAGSLVAAGDTPVVLQNNTFMTSEDIAVDVNCVTRGEAYCVAICDGNTFMGGDVGVHAVGDAAIRIENNTFMGTAIGILLGDLPASNAADVLQATVTENTFMGTARAKIVVSLPTADFNEEGNVFHEVADWPTVTWNGPAPWVEPVDVAYLRNPIGPARWWRISQEGPSERVGAGVCYLSGDRTFVLMGGRNSSGTLTDTWVFDLDPSAPVGITPSDHFQWSQEDGTFFDPLGSVSDARRYDMAMASPWDADDPCLLFGGHNGVDPDGAGPATDHVFSDLYFFDEAERWWERLEPAPDPQDGAPVARYGATFTALANNLYLLVGGVDSLGAALQDAWVYDRANNIWDKRADTTGGRSFHGAANANSNVVLFWGGSEGGGLQNRTAYRYQYGGSGSDQWLEVTGVDSSLVQSDLSMALVSRDMNQAHRYLTFGGTDVIDGVLSYEGEALLLTSLGDGQLISGAEYSDPPADPLVTNPPPSRFPVSRGRYAMSSSTSPADYAATLEPRTDIAVLLFGGTDGTSVLSDTWLYMPGGD